jgi:alkylation response protein AidB-like acyl-CoA dehydrogenase
MYSFEPTKEQILLHKEIEEYASDYLDADAAFDSLNQRRNRFQMAGKIGLPGLAIPKEYGGKGLDALSTFLALESLGYACKDNGFNFAICAHLLACTIPVWLYGNENLKRQYLPDLCSGKKIIANAMSEPHSGSDAFNMKTIAEPVDGSYSISGTKNFVSNMLESDMVLLYAMTDKNLGHLGGVSAFLLDSQIHDYKKGSGLNKSGLDSCSLGSLFLDHTNVHSNYIVGQVGRGASVFNKSMEWERTCLGACHIGNTRRLLEQAKIELKQDITKTRKTSQYKSDKLAEWNSKLNAVSLLGYQTAWKMSNNKIVTKEAAMTKLLISELYKEICSGLLSLHEFGQDLNHDLVQSFKDSISSTIYSGTSEIQKLIISQQLGI